MKGTSKTQIARKIFTASMAVHPLIPYDIVQLFATWRKYIFPRKHHPINRQKLKGFLRVFFFLQEGEDNICETQINKIAFRAASVTADTSWRVRATRGNVATFFA